MVKGTKDFSSESILIDLEIGFKSRLEFLDDQRANSLITGINPSSRRNLVAGSKFGRAQEQTYHTKPNHGSGSSKGSDGDLSCKG